MELRRAALVIALLVPPSLVFAQGSNQPGPSGPETLTCTITGVVPLPTGAATAANQTDGSQKTQIMLPGGVTAASFDIDGNFATSLTNIAGNDVNLGAGNIDTGTQRVVLASNQPSVATTEASAASIKLDVDKIPSQGQALAAASMPVVLPATQITALTPPAAITNFALETGGNLDKLAKPSNCGTTPYDSGALDVPPNYPTQVSTTTTCATAVSVTNQTRTPIRFMLYNNATAFRNYYTDWISPGEARTIPLNGLQLSSGVRWNGSDMGLVAQIRGYQ